jgi:hypothetical protein
MAISFVAIDNKLAKIQVLTDLMHFWIILADIL